MKSEILLFLFDKFSNVLSIWPTNIIFLICSGQGAYYEGAAAIFYSGILLLKGEQVAMWLLTVNLDWFKRNLDWVFGYEKHITHNFTVTYLKSTTATSAQKTTKRLLCEGDGVLLQALFFYSMKFFVHFFVFNVEIPAENR